jgi:Xaa-Pro dipeptidase
MPSLPPYVLSGNDNPTIVREPSMRPLTRGDAVMIDMVGSFEGYQADIARTFVLGTATAEQRRIWAVLERAFDAVLAIVRPGVRCADLHTAAASVIADAGYALPHRIGHGIGLAHSFEWPSLDTEEALLEAGMTICIEPGIYVRGAGSMKIEDEVLVTPQGSELLTHATRNLEVAC